jgi:hypothetical protein
MVKHEFALLETGCNTIEEFAKAFWNKKPLNYTTSDIRKTYCNKCNIFNSNCKKCFIYNSLQEIYKTDPFA